MMILYTMPFVGMLDLTMINSLSVAFMRRRQIPCRVVEMHGSVFHVNMVLTGIAQASLLTTGMRLVLDRVWLPNCFT